MLECKIKSGTKVTCGNLSITCNAGYLKEDNRKKDILVFEKDNYLTIREKGLAFDSVGDYVEFSLKIDKLASNKVLIFTGDRVPFKLGLKKADGKYAIYTEVTVQDENKKKIVKNAVSTKTINANQWYRIRFFLLSGENCVMVDDEPFIRRVYEDKILLESYGDLKFGIRSTGNKIEMCEMAISRDIYQEKSRAGLITTLEKAISEKFFVVENTYHEYVDSGNDAGSYKGTTHDKKSGNDYYVYEKGAVVFNKNKGGIFLITFQYEYYKGDWEYLGFPQKQVSFIGTDGKHITFVIYEKDCVFYIKEENRKVHMRGEALIRYMAADLKTYNNWYPLSVATMYNGDENITYWECSNGLYIYEIESPGSENLVVILPKKLHKEYSARYFKGMTGNPLGDYMVYYDGYGKPFYYMLPCQNGWLHYFHEWDKSVFSSLELGSPKNSVKKRTYSDTKKIIESYDFTNGIVILYPDSDSLVVHNGLVLRFDRITSGKIDDCWPDESAELYIKLTVYNDNGMLVDDKRLGTKSYKGPQSYKFSAGNYNQFEIPVVNTNSYFHFLIKVYDYDANSDPDYLGCFNYTYDIKNGWGLDKYDGAVKLANGIHTLNMTAQGKDNRKGLSNIQLYMAIGNVYDMDEMKQNYRKNLAFPFRNFTGSYDFTKTSFQNVFTNVKYEWWNLGWLYDLIFYEACKRSLKGAKCYGFAVTELETINEEGLFIPPLDSKQYLSSNKSLTANNLTFQDLIYNVGRTICDRYLNQKGWDSLMWQWRKMCSDEYLIPQNAIKSIKNRIDKEGCCLLILKPKDMKGHAVVAYKYEGSGINTKFYVMDCNRPYVAKDAKNKDASHITFSKINSVQAKVLLRYDNDSKYGTDMDYRYLCEFPYSVAARRPRVPNTADILVGSLMNMIIGLLDSMIDMISVNDDSGRIYEDGGTDTQYKKIFPVADFAATGDQKPKMFLIKDGKVSMKMRANATGTSTLIFASEKVKYEVKINVTKGETIEILTQDTNDLRGFRFYIRRSGKENGADIYIKKAYKRDCYSNTFTCHLNVKENWKLIEGTKVGIRLRIKEYDLNNNLINTIYFNTTGDKELKKMEEEDQLPIVPPINLEPAGTVGTRQMTPVQFANIHRCSVSTIRRYCRAKKIAGVTKVGRKWLIPANSTVTIRRIRKKK